MPLQKAEHIYNHTVERRTAVHNLLLEIYGKDRVSLPKIKTFAEACDYYSANRPGHIAYDFLNNLQDYSSGNNILIYYPKIKVTNETDEFTIINDVYVKLFIDHYGRLYDFSFVVASPTLAQYSAGYQHSHLPTIDHHSLPSFDHPCLGTGPIKSTRNRLSRTNLIFNEEEKLDWILFFTELDMYLSTESLAGGPYIHLSNINNRGNSGNNEVALQRESIISMYEINNSWEFNLSTFQIQFLQKFISYYLHNFKGLYKASINSISLFNHRTLNIIDICEAFLSFINDEEQAEYKDSILHRFTEDGWNNGIFLSLSYDSSKDVFISHSNRNIHINESVQNQPMFIFNGKFVFYRVKESTTAAQPNEFYVLNIEIINLIQYFIVYILNFSNLKNGKFKEKVLFL